MCKIYAILICFVLSGCNEGFVYKKHLIHKYYLIAVDVKSDVSVSLLLSSGNYIGRIPAEVKEYAIIADSLIVGKISDYYSKDYDHKTTYYILNIKKDHDYAELRDVVTGPVDSLQFEREWRSKYEFNFISVY